ncbi:MAG: hypothetical protein CBC04_00680 [Verrucomicrobia bacterium TMED44]|nr:MAG: hypothetical protein CBC04_00680 [Verrucomicrobia bacterium TMED44]
MINFIKSILTDKFKDKLKRAVNLFNNKIHPIKLYKNLILAFNQNSLEILIYPKISSYEKLNEFYWILTYYLYPIKDKIKNIYIFSELKLDRLNLNVNLSNEIKEFNELKNKFHTIDENSINTKSYNVILINDQIEENSNSYKYDKKYMIDFKENKEASETLINISQDFTDKKEVDEILKNSVSRLKNIKKEITKNKVLLCGSGPTIENFDINYENYDVMICNSIVKNRGFLNIAKPKYLMFGDPIFHPGPSKYSETFREDVRYLIEEHNTQIFTLSRDYAIYKNVFEKKYLNNFSFVPMKKINNYNTNLLENFYIKGTGNILTLLMLPIAFSLYNEIMLAGFDGRKKEENSYYWKHSNKNQYDDLLEEIKFIHSGYFKKNNFFYDQYYENHIETVNKWIDLSKINDKRIKSLTPSNIF